MPAIVVNFATRERTYGYSLREGNELLYPNNKTGPLLADDFLTDDHGELYILSKIDGVIRAVVAATLN